MLTPSPVHGAPSPRGFSQAAPRTATTIASPAHRCRLDRVTRDEERIARTFAFPRNRCTVRRRRQCFTRCSARGISHVEARTPSRTSGPRQIFRALSPALILHRPSRMGSSAGWRRSQRARRSRWRWSTSIIMGGGRKTLVGSGIAWRGAVSATATPAVGDSLSTSWRARYSMLIARLAERVVARPPPASSRDRICASTSPCQSSPPCTASKPGADVAFVHGAHARSGHATTKAAPATKNNTRERRGAASVGA